MASHADKQVSLAATHRSLEVEDSLGRDSTQAGGSLGDEVLHALGDVGLFDELCAVALGVDPLVKLLDLIAQFCGQRVGLELAGVANGFLVSAV